MKLYLLPTGGVFGSATGERLPATVRILPCNKPQCEVQIGKETLYATDGVLTLPESLTYGIHAVKVDGKHCEGLLVTRGQVRPVGIELRDLLPTLSHLCALESRLAALEEKHKETKVNYLF